MTKQRRPREEDSKHLAFLRQLGCIICGDDATVEAAHVRYSDSRAGKTNTGMQQKPHDRFALPLCGRHHKEQHGTNERGWWEAKGIDPIFYSLALYGCSGDHQTGANIIRVRLDTMQ